MERIWTVPPDPATGLVDRNEFVQAIMDGEAHVWRSGGVLTILVGRHPTGTPGEMVTTSALVQWKDRTDARAQPEVAGDVVPAAAPPPPLAVAEPPAPGAAPAPAVVAEPVADLDAERLEEEDVSEIPAALR